MCHGPDRSSTIRFTALLALSLALLPIGAIGQGLTPAFTYQGELRLASGPAEGSYDMEFRLFDAEADGAPIGAIVAVDRVAVTGGLFSVILDFGAGQFAGDRQWLEIRIREAGGGPFETLSPRTEVTAAPYAWGAAAALVDSVTSLSIVDGTIGAADIDTDAVQRRVAGSCPAGQLMRAVNSNGSVVCASGESGGGGSGTGTVTQVDTGAGLTGGPITSTGTIAIAEAGIGGKEIDPTQVQRRVSSSCAAGTRMTAINEDGTVVCDDDTTGNDWRLGGNAGTDATTDFIGTTDGQPLVLRAGNAQAMRIEPSAEIFEGLPNTANVIGGSRANTVTVGVRGATIAGGGLPSGDSDPFFSIEEPNRVSDHFGTIGGGYDNTAGDSNGDHASAVFPTVAGGAGNVAAGAWSAIGGGVDNTASGGGSAIAGGEGNVAAGGIATIAGGGINSASGEGSTVAGGLSNDASGPMSAVAGGESNTAGGDHASVGGGVSNTANGTGSAISGGESNTASDENSAVGGGFNNNASGRFSSVAGGASNTASGDRGSVGGGSSNFASGRNGAVAGGELNTASGIWSSVAGGVENCAGGTASWAGGTRAKVRPGSSSGAVGFGCNTIPFAGTSGDAGTFVWADSDAAAFVSTGQNQFLVRAAGGVGLGTNSPDAQLHVVEPVNGFASNSADHVAVIENSSTSTSTGPDVLALKTSAQSPSGSTNFITFFDGIDGALGRIEGDGGGGIVFASGGADFAEWLPERDPQASIEPGDVVGWHPDGVSHDTEGALRFMVVSTRPIVTGNAPADEQTDGWVPIGFVGQVPVQVRGPVTAGDWIIPSGDADGSGVAVAPEALEPSAVGQVVGRALESTSEPGTHQVTALVGLGHADALGGAVARINRENAALRDRLATVEAANGDLLRRLAGLEESQQQALALLRAELGRLQAASSTQLAARER